MSGSTARKRDSRSRQMKMFIYKTKTLMHVCVCVCSSLWDDTVPPPPGPVHLPLPADVIPGCGHVLHRPPASTASMRGAGGRSGCLPAAHETAPVGLLDMAHHAVTKTDHRGRHGACFILFFFIIIFIIIFQTPLISYQDATQARTSQPIWQSSAQCLQRVRKEREACKARNT